jgi:hypothetical protein
MIHRGGSFFYLVLNELGIPVKLVTLSDLSSFQLRSWSLKTVLKNRIMAFL